ncbi:NUDIX hydrolase [Streptomyces indicus]|uniref:ADP-ribose pyrophosphatase YjhB, NUDIX family n=1 Tax=Streptomyces indicus TaxID=417292 RepID=A0A1G8ZL32_9ACTN|nr:NUDIX domain-containing protein [Streptomyces indicus]SDK15819.1 ADP-ribose pyrophosphatase YjhB, NUDIX family [Streptomyces indicus]
MPPLKLRHAARGLVVDEQERILLCRFQLDGGLGVWSTPGGGVEPGESVREALHRELLEEIGLVVEGEPPHVWHRKFVDAGYAPGYDGAAHDYFFIRTRAFTPAGTMSAEELAAEGISGFRWWSLAELAGHRGPDLFAPRDLVTPLTALLTDGAPERPVILGR